MPLTTVLPTSDTASACPLCHGTKIRLFYTSAEAKPFYTCPDCALIFLPPRFHLSAEEEKERYDLHQNNPEDKKYVRFLNRLVTPLLPFLKEGMRGLDFGSGPGPTVSVLLEDRGFSVENYDPFYAPEKALLEKKYDFITATEVVEHFAEPHKEFHRLYGLLKGGGLLAVMTQVFRPEMDFGQWWYWREPTHIVFYQPATFRWIAQSLGMDLCLAEENVYIFRKA